MLGVATTLIGLGIVALPGHEAQAVAIFSQFGADIDGEAAGDQSGRSFAMSAGAAPKLSFHVPAAAHTSSYCNKSGSTNTRNCVL